MPTDSEQEARIRELKAQIAELTAQIAELKRAPEEAWEAAKRDAEEFPSEAANIYEDFATFARERAIFDRSDFFPGAEKLAAHAEGLAQKIRSSQPSKESTNAPRLKWQWTDTAFALFCKGQCDAGAVPYKHEGSTSRNEIPWESFCLLYVDKNGKPFEPQKLSGLLSKLSSDSPGVRPKKIRHEAEVGKILKGAKAENERNAVVNPSPQRIRGSLSESGVPKSAPGRGVGSKRF